jgi:magnesium chelatase family protein
MSYAKVLSAGLVGVTGHLIEVEADLATGLPAMVLSGLPDTALHEARDRVRAAIVNSGQEWPSRRITVNLLPATLPKEAPASMSPSRRRSSRAPASCRWRRSTGW